MVRYEPVIFVKVTLYFVYVCGRGTPCSSSSVIFLATLDQGEMEMEDYRCSYTGRIKDSCLVLNFVMLMH